MCTRVLMNMFPGYMVSARSLDFFGPADPSLVITPRGISGVGGESPACIEWVAKYGTVVIYAGNGKFPMDGLNEKGLAAHTLFYTNGSQVQADNLDKPVLESPSWVSYVLQNFASVKEAIAALREVRLIAVHKPIDYPSENKHMAIEDVYGDSAIIEIDNGEVHIYHDSSYQIMCNVPEYHVHLANLEKFKGALRSQIPGGVTTEERMVRANFALKQIPVPQNEEQAKGFALSVLQHVSYPLGENTTETQKKTMETLEKFSRFPEKNIGYGTYWTTVIDLMNGKFHFKSISSPSDVFIDLKEIDFTNETTIKRISALDEYAIRGWNGNILRYATKG